MVGLDHGGGLEQRQGVTLGAGREAGPGHLLERAPCLGEPALGGGHHHAVPDGVDRVLVLRVAVPEVPADQGELLLRLGRVPAGDGQFGTPERGEALGPGAQRQAGGGRGGGRALGPVPEGEQGLGLVGVHPGSGVGQAVAVADLDAVVGGGDGLQRAAHRLQRGGQVDADPAEEVHQVQLFGAVPDRVHLGESFLDASRVRDEPAAGEAGVQLVVLVADEPGVLHGVVAVGEGLRSRLVERLPTRHVRMDVGLHGRRREPPHQLLRRGQLLPAVPLVERLHQTAALHEEPGLAQRVGLGGEDPNCLLGDGQRAFAVAAEAGGDSGLGHHVDVAQRGVLRIAAGGRVDLGVVEGAEGGEDFTGDVVPELHRPLQEPQLLGVGVAAAGLDGGPEHGGQGLGGVVGGVPVAGEAGGAFVVADEGGIGLQGFGVPAVDAGALPGQQIVADGLADQGVPEAVAVAVGRGLQQVGADGRAQGLVEVVLAEPGDGGQQFVFDEGAALGDDPGDPLGVLGQRLDPDEQEVAERFGEPGAVAAALQGAGQLLDEEGVAVGAFEDLVDECGLGDLGEDAGQLAADLVVAEPVEFDAGDATQPVQLGEEGAQGVAAVDVVGAVGADDHEAAGTQGAEEIGEQMPGGGVRPVQILQDEDDRAVGGDLLQQASGEFEEAGGAVLVGGVPVGRAQLGQEAGQLALLAGAGGGHLLGQSTPQGAQGGREGGERQPVGPDLDAGSDGDHGVAPLGRRDELLDQAGLADARLAADQQRLRIAGSGPRERLGERRELLGAPDEHGAD
ncbi:hypothetical protein P376_4642 [Streptomyces sp. HCCB10043]|nr:hypothetical protein P376_4642 [Streptomyces sp. HCCB10043]